MDAARVLRPRLMCQKENDDHEEQVAEAFAQDLLHLYVSGFKGLFTSFFLFKKNICENLNIWTIFEMSFF